MIAAAEKRKQMRGTRRVCRACAVPFYDLGRDPIVCPACSAHYAPDAAPARDETGTQAAAGGPGWGRSLRQRQPAPAVAEVGSDTDTPVESDGDDADAATEILQDEELELEPDDSDVSELIDRDDTEDAGER